MSWARAAGSRRPYTRSTMRLSACPIGGAIRCGCVPAARSHVAQVRRRSSGEQLGIFSFVQAARRSRRTFCQSKKRRPFSPRAYSKRVKGMRRNRATSRGIRCWNSAEAGLPEMSLALWRARDPDPAARFERDIRESRSGDERATSRPKADTLRDADPRDGGAKPKVGRRAASR